MVRNIVSVLIKVGKGEIDPIEVVHLLNSKDRSRFLLYPTSPACGLYLVDVLYNTDRELRLDMGDDNSDQMGEVQEGDKDFSSD